MDALLTRRQPGLLDTLSRSLSAGLGATLEELKQVVRPLPVSRAIVGVWNDQQDAYNEGW